VNQPQQQNTQAPAAQPQQPQAKQVIRFSIASMDQYSHEELQKVIRRYDEEHKKNRLQILQHNKELDEKQEQAQQVHQKLSKAQSVAEDIQMYDEEIKRLKEYMNMLS